MKKLLFTSLFALLVAVFSSCEVIEDIEPTVNTETGDDPSGGSGGGSEDDDTNAPD